MTFAAALPALITAAGSIGSGYLAGRSSQPKETKIQRSKRHLIDKLLDSLNGKGPYKDLYSTDEGAFQKSFVDPAKSMFRNQIAPQIQQQSIYGGQQRGTGLDDQLLRAGVDLDSLINQHYMDFQNRGKDRMQNTINSILGGTEGVQQPQSRGDTFSQATSGYLSSPGFQDAVTGFFKQNPQQSQGPVPPTRKGFEPDWQTARNLPAGDPRWNQF